MKGMIVLFKFIKKKKNFNNPQDIIDYMQINNREIILNSITSIQATQIDAAIRYWNFIDDKKTIPNGQRKPIKIYINSYGGNLNDALAIADSIKLSRTPVFTFNMNIVFKESILIYLAGDKRYAYPNSLFMFEFNNMDQDEVINNFYINNIKNLFLEKASIPENQLDRYFKNKTYFTAKQALDSFICNEVQKNHYYNK